MGESQLWLELNNALRKRLPRPLNLCQFLTLPIGDITSTALPADPPERAETPRRFVVPRNRRRSAKRYYDVGRWHAPKNNRGFCLAEREDNLRMDVSISTRYRCVRMQFPATGVTDKLGAPAHWKVPTYPERFAFIQIVRAWAVWRNGHPDLDCLGAARGAGRGVRRHHQRAHRRVGAAELPQHAVLCRNRLRRGVLERRQFQMMPDTQLNEIVRQLQLSSEHCTVEVTPPPSLEARADRSLSPHCSHAISFDVSGKISEPVK